MSVSDVFLISSCSGGDAEGLIYSGTDLKGQKSSCRPSWV